MALAYGPDSYFESQDLRKLLLKMVDDPSKWINVHAARAVSRFPRKDIHVAIQKLITVLKTGKPENKDELVRVIMQSLATTGIYSREQSEPIIEKLADQRIQGDWIEDALRHFARRQAVFILGKYAERSKDNNERARVMSHLQKCFEGETNPGVRIALCEAFLKNGIRNEKIYEAHLRALRSDEREFRTQAIGMLWSYSLPEKHLMQGYRIALKDIDSGNRVMALRALCSYGKGARRLLPLLEACLDEDIMYCPYAIKMILKSDPKHKKALARLELLLPLIEHEAKSSHPEMRALAREMLELGKKFHVRK
jgi:hypothetical protein